MWFLATELRSSSVPTEPSYLPHTLCFSINLSLLEWRMRWADWEVSGMAALAGQGKIVGILSGALVDALAISMEKSYWWLDVINYLSSDLVIWNFVCFMSKTPQDVYIFDSSVEGFLLCSVFVTFCPNVWRRKLLFDKFSFHKMVFSNVVTIPLN